MDLTSWVGALLAPSKPPGTACTSLSQSRSLSEPSLTTAWTSKYCVPGWADSSTFQNSESLAIALRSACASSGSADRSGCGLLAAAAAATDGAACELARLPQPGS